MIGQGTEHHLRSVTVQAARESLGRHVELNISPRVFFNGEIIADSVGQEDTTELQGAIDVGKSAGRKSWTVLYHIG